MKSKWITALMSVALAVGLFGVLPISAGKLAAARNFDASSAVSLAAVGDILIVEVNADPNLAEPNNEFFELYNSTNATINLGNWEFCDNSNGGTPAGSGCYHLPNPTNLASGARLVISFSNAATLATNYGCSGSTLNVAQFTEGWFAGTSGQNLANSNDRLAVYDNSSPRVRIDEVSYGTDTTWLNPAAPSSMFNNSGNSLQRLGYSTLSFTDTTTNADWASSAAVSGAIGTPCDVIAGPNLVVTKSVGESSVSPGDAYNYTLIVRNVGGQAATNVVVSDDFDEAKLDFLGSSPATTTFNSGTLLATWNVGTLNPSQSATIVVDVAALGGASGSIANTATATGDGLGTSTSNATSVTIVAPPVPPFTNGANTCGTIPGGNAAEGPGFCDAASGPGTQSILLSQAPCRGNGEMCFFVDVDPTKSETFRLHFAATAAVGNLVITPYTGTVAGTPDNRGDATGLSSPQTVTAATGVTQYRICFKGTGGEVRSLAVEFTAGTPGATGRLHSDAWCMTNKTFCPTCRYDFSVVARCGETLRLPFYDFENMVNLRVYKPGVNGAPQTTTPAKYKVVRVQGAQTCTYYNFDGTTGTYDAGLCGKLPPLGNPPNPPGFDKDAGYVSWYDVQAVKTTNAASGQEYWGDACYAGLAGPPGAANGYCPGGGLCEADSPGDSNYNGQAELYIEISTRDPANGCGVYTLQSDRATGFNWNQQGFCTSGSNELGAHQVYFNGAAACGGGNAPGIAPFIPLPELFISQTLTLETNAPVSCSGNTSVQVPVTIKYNLANSSCGAATGPFTTQFTVVDQAGSHTVTDSGLATLAGFTERLETVGDTVTCGCTAGTPTGTVQITAATVDSTNAVAECSEGVNPTNCVPPNAPTQTAVLNCASLPLAVTLSDFYAEQTADDVQIVWETNSELNNRGFHLWRGVESVGPDRQLNSALIPSQSQGSPGGFFYTWTDTADLVPGTTYYYWLEDVNVNGVVTRHGPVSVEFFAPSAVGLRSVDAGATSAVVIAAAVAVALAGGYLALRRRTA